MFGPAKEINVPLPKKQGARRRRSKVKISWEGGSALGAHRQLTLNPYSSAVIGTS